ncbi:MAG TPA: efflux RND transporter periplasmic adaptor subunit [Propylenella sp.]
MIKRFLVALVLVVVVCGGLVGFNLFRSKMISDFFANQQMPAATISAVEVKPVTWTPEIDAIGTLFASQGVDVATPIEGVVKSIEFKANDSVEEGELLVQIDDAVERADILSAEAAVERDRAAMARAEQLTDRGVSSDAALEQAESALAVSRSNLARLRATIDLKAVEAPFSGIIGIPKIEVGQYVQPGMVVATLQQLGTMRVDFTVPEQEMANLRMGQAVSFGIGEDDFPYDGRIIGIEPKVDPQTRLISVRAEAANPDSELRPGQFARIRLQLPPVDDVIVVPQTAVVTSLYGDYVYAVEPSEVEADASPDSAAEAPETPPSAASSGDGPQLVAKQIFVEIGRRQGNVVEVRKGLEPGQTIVTSGQNKLANNMPVKIDNDIDPAAVALGEGDGRS